MNRISALELVTVLALTVVGGCVEKSKDLTRSEREQISRFVSEEATTPEHPLDIGFEDKITLTGYDLSAESWTPGRPMTITWHWKVDRALEDGWRLFTHVSDGHEGARINEDGSGVVRELYQPGRWKAGEYIRDQQEITLPADWNATTAIAYVGLWHGDHRLRITRGPNDGDNRARAATIPVGASAANGAAETPTPAREFPTLAVGRADAVTIDGRLDEAAWQRAAATGAFVNTMTGTPADFRVVAKALWDDENLYVAFEVEDTYLASEYRNQDDHLWEKDAVEIMVDPDGDGRNYFEMQVSPRNVSFDTRYDSRRQPQPIGHADWQSNLRSAVTLRGEVDDDDEDEGYTVEIAIPWTAFAAGEPPARAPRAGEEWRANFYVMDTQESGQRANGWSPPKVGDFHVPDRFGALRFEGASRADGPTVVQPDSPLGMAVMPQLPPGLRQRIQQQGNIPDLERARRDDNRPQQGETMPTPENPVGMAATPMAATPMAATPMGAAPMDPAAN